MREQVKRFAEEMEKVLSENDNRKSGYQACTYDYLYMRLLQETTELFEAIYDTRVERCGGDVVRECVDVANFAMMIADKYLKRKAIKRAFEDK